MLEAPALHSASHTVPTGPRFSNAGTLDPSNFDIMDLRTVVKDGKDVLYWHRSEADLIRTLKHGANRLQLPFLPLHDGH